VGEGEVGEVVQRHAEKKVLSRLNQEFEEEGLNEAKGFEAENWTSLM
jgi:hypothetical protein